MYPHSTAATVLRRVTNLVLIVAVAATAYVANSTHEVAEGGYHHMSPVEAIRFREMRGLDDPARMNIPRWTEQIAEEFGGFRDVEDLPVGTIPSQMVVVKSDASVQTMTFDRAYALNHDDERANDVWTVGYR